MQTISVEFRKVISDRMMGKSDRRSVYNTSLERTILRYCAPSMPHSAMNIANLLTVGLASLTALALALPNLKAQSPNTTPQPITQQSPSTSPRRLTIKVSVAEPSDLKVKEGDKIKRIVLESDRVLHPRNNS